MSDNRGIVYDEDGQPLYRDIGKNRNYFHNGKEYVHNWYTATTEAERDWNAAQEHYWKLRKTSYDPRRSDSAENYIKWKREDYRRRILTWYRELCLPMKPGECVPGRVAELLAEAWDLGERPLTKPYNTRGVP